MGLQSGESFSGREKLFVNILMAMLKLCKINEFTRVSPSSNEQQVKCENLTLYERSSE